MKSLVIIVIQDAVKERVPTDGKQEARRFMKAENGRGVGNAFGGSGSRC
jgi:hypothetical protein